jgi:hypothetical protein
MPGDSSLGAGKIKNMLQSFKTKVQRKDRKLEHYKFIKPKLCEIIMDSDRVHYSLSAPQSHKEGRSSYLFCFAEKIRMGA